MKKSSVVICAVVAFTFLLSLSLWLVKFPGKRYVFMFESFDDGSVKLERRFLPRKPVQGMIHLYVDELLLGPETERCRPLFTRGTSSLSCFLRNGVLYVTLTDDFLSEENGASRIKDGFELFKKNILHNFKNVKSIDIFVNGERLYEEVG